jgi:hypothetical protein
VNVLKVLVEYGYEDDSGCKWFIVTISIHERGKVVDKGKLVEPCFTEMFVDIISFKILYKIVSTEIAETF